MRKFSKRVLSAVLALVLTFSVLAVVPFAADADIAVRVNKSSCLQGELIVATVYFPKQCNKIASLDLELNYDKSKLQFVSLERGPGLEAALKEQINGKVYSEYSKNPGVVSWSLAGSNNFKFEGTFAFVTFKVRGTAVNGKATLDLNVKDAGNSGYVDITSTVTADDTDFEIIRNSIKDFVFKKNSAGTGYVITAYQCATVNDLVIPSEHEGLPVVGIEKGVFETHVELKTVVLPEHLTSIGDNAFSDCINLESISIPDTVVSIGANAFKNCQVLADVKLPLGLTKINANTFYDCAFLKSIEIPFNVKEIGRTAFYGCYTLSAVKISKNTTTIGDGAFAMCSALGIEFTTVEGNTALPGIIAKKFPEMNAKYKYVEDLSLGKATCETKLDYTGAPLKPQVILTLNNGAEVQEGKDFKVVYVDNVESGTAKVYVVGIDGYGEGYNLSFTVYCDHASVNKTVVKKVTCTEDGVNECKCTHCGYTYSETIAHKGHPSGEWVYDKRPTYDKTGTKHKVCTVCGQSYEKNTVADKVYPDVNLDKKVNSTDALLVLQHTVGKEIYISPDGLFNADTNGDTKINSTDALIILKISVGKITLS